MTLSASFRSGSLRFLKGWSPGSKDWGCGVLCVFFGSLYPSDPVLSNVGLRPTFEILQSLSRKDVTPSIEGLEGTPIFSSPQSKDVRLLPACLLTLASKWSSAPATG